MAARNAIFALLPALMAAPAFADDGNNDDIGNITRFTLDNGMQVLVREDHRAPVVVSQVWYNVGSSYEARGVTGIAHMLEHMMFKGTDKFPEGEFSAIVSREGGRLNAFTSRDFTAYFEIMAADRLPIAFELESDRMVNLQLTDDALATEREVILEERRLRSDDRPEGRFGERFAAIANPGTGYAHPIIGWEDDIRSISLDDLQSWYAHWYSPSNATLVVAGAVQADAVYALAEEYFGDIPAREVPAVRDPSVFNAAGERRLVYRDAQARIPQLRLSYDVPSFATVEDRSDVYALLMLSAILDGGDGARLAEQLVRGNEVVAAAGAGYNPMARLEADFSLYGVPTDGQVDELEAALRAQIDALKTEQVAEEELERARNQLLADHLFELDSVFYQAMQLGMLETTGAGWQTLQDYQAGISAVTAEDIRSVAERYLLPEHLAVGVMLPDEQGSDS